MIGVKQHRFNCRGKLTKDIAFVVQTYVISCCELRHVLAGNSLLFAGSLSRQNSQIFMCATVKTESKHGIWFMVIHPIMDHCERMWKVCKSFYKSIADHPPTWVYNVTMADVEKKLLPCGSWQPEFPAEQAGRLAGWQALQDHSSGLLDSGIQLAIQISRHSLNSTPGCRLEAIGIFERNGTAIDWSWLVTAKLLFLLPAGQVIYSLYPHIPKTWTSGPWLPWLSP